MIEATDLNLILRKRKAISALFLYAIYLAQDGQQGMADAFLRVSRASNSNHREFMWRHVGPYIVPLVGKPTTPSLDSIIILASHHVPWNNKRVNKDTVARWAAATSAIPYTEEVGQSVVDALLQIASVASLRPHIPIGIWAWLKRRPSPPPKCLGRWQGIQGNVICHVRALGDIEILKSYFLFIWSEWQPFKYPWEHRSLQEMLTSIQEDFSGIGMGHHRKELVNRLDHILGQLDLGLEHLRLRKPSLDDDDVRVAKEQYRELKKLLLEVDGEAVDTPTRASLRSVLFGLLTPTDPYRIPLNLHVRFASPVSIISHLYARSYLHGLAALPVYQLSYFLASPFRLLTAQIYLDVRVPPGFSRRRKGFCLTLVTVVPLDFLGIPYSVSFRSRNTLFVSISPKRQPIER